MKRIIITLCMMLGFSASSLLPMNGGYDRWGNQVANGMYDRWGNYRPADQGQLCRIEGEMKQPNELTRLACWHRHCTDCFGDTIVQAIRDREIGRLRCPERGCEHRLTQQEIAQFLINEPGLQADYERLVRQHVAQRAVAADPVNGRHCPTPNCDHAYLYQGAPQAIDCPQCHQNYCNNCLAQHPRIAQCQARAGIAEIIRNIDGIKACPRCQRGIQKNEGCNHMTCQRPNGCGHEFCWLCLGNYHGHNYDACARIQANQGVNQPQPARQYPYPGPDEPFVILGPDYAYRNRTSPIPYVIGGVVVIAASVAAYKLYKYLYHPKVIVVQDLKTSIENLHKEAIKARMQLVGPNGYVYASFKNYFEMQVAQNAFKDLDKAKMIELKKIVNDLENGLITGNCDAHYNALVNFIIALDTKIAPVAEVIPVPSKEVPAKTSVPVSKPAAPKKVKKPSPKGTPQRGRQTRKIK